MVPGVRIVVLGKQGAGKGTQCGRLSRHYVVPHIATGDMLRNAVRLHTPLGKEAKRYMDKGELVPDELLVRLVGERLDQDDTKERGFVLDGFPRTVQQAVSLDGLLDPGGIDLVANLVVPMAVVLRRLSSRRVCRDCGEIYSLASRPSVDWTCDTCGGEVVQRDDDTEGAIRRRLALYDQQTAPLIARYRRAHRLVSVTGTGSADAVTERLVRAIDGRRLQLAVRDPISDGPSGPTQEKG